MGMAIPRDRTLSSILRQACALKQVRKSDLMTGDWLQVTTRNSTYSICVLGNGLFSISGGWVDKRGLSPWTTTISGCTWGGSTIKVDIAAACGLRLEFGKRVVTSSIRRIVHLRVGGRVPIS